jgi:hypothetical protein
MFRACTFVLVRRGTRLLVTGGPLSGVTVVEPALELARPGFGRLVGRRVVHSEPSIRSVT